MKVQGLPVAGPPAAGVCCWHSAMPDMFLPATCCRLCYLVERLRHGSSSDTRATTNAALLGTPLAAASSSGTGVPPTSAGLGLGPPPLDRSGSAGASSMSILAEQPAAVADPLSVLSGQQWQKQQHVEGGLFFSADMLGRPAASQARSSSFVGQRMSSGGSAPGAVLSLPIQHSSWTVPIAEVGLVGGGSSSGPFGLCRAGSSGAGCLQPGSHRGSGPQVVTSSVTGVRYSYSGGGASAAAAGGTAGLAASQQGTSSSSSDRDAQMQAAHRASHSGTLTGSLAPHQAAAAPGVAAPGQMAALVPAVVHVGRGVLVAWLRCVLDVLAALTLVDPAAVLNELSSKLAGEAGWPWHAGSTMCCWVWGFAW